MTPATCMCALSLSRCRKDASRPVSRSPFVAIECPFLSPRGPVRRLRTVYAADLLVPWYAAVMDELPATAPFDAHTQTGFNDPDGLSSSPAALIAGLQLTHAPA